MVNSRNETPSLLRVRDAKLCMVAVFGIIFVVEIEQKQAIWCLKCLLINLLLFELCKKKNYMRM